MTQQTCKQPDCTNPVRARELCGAHYQQWRHENPDQIRATATNADSLPERIAMHSQPGENGCIVWTGYLSNGLPWLNIKGRGVNVRRAVLDEVDPKRTRSPRFAVTTCDTPNCVAPDHLRWSEHSTEVVTAVPNDEAEQLVADHKAGVLNVAKAARRLGVTRPTIYRAMERLGYSGHKT